MAALILMNQIKCEISTVGLGQSFLANAGSQEMAERQGFEPWRPCGLRAFQARALSRAMRPLLNEHLTYRAVGDVKSAVRINPVSLRPSRRNRIAFSYFTFFPSGAS